MNQSVLEQTKEQRMLAKANFLVKNKKVRRSPCEESRNVWMVGSYSKPKAWYVIRFHDDMQTFECGCEAYKYSKDNCCLHLIAIAIFEGGGPL